jgi:uncharacterized coiled-coil protein SlyX
MSGAGDILLSMVTPEQVSRRIDRAEQDITAIADTVLEIKDTVEAHTETLAEHGHKLDTITTSLDGVEARLDGLETRMSEGFAEILRQLGNDRPGERA